MTFIDVQMPPNIAEGAQGGPMFNTLITVTGSGVEQRVGWWSMPRGRWTVSQPEMKPADMYALKDLFTVVLGRQNSFRFKDWADYKDVDVSTGTGMGTFQDSVGGTAVYTGSPAVMQMYKSYTYGSATVQRKITKPVLSTIVVNANGVALVYGTDYTIDDTSGVMTVLTSQTGKTMSWTGQFDVHVRFDMDDMKFTQLASTVHVWTDIMVVEIRD